jgi:GTP-binding protein
VLLHVVDSTSPDPVTDYELIEGEVHAYDPGLDAIPRAFAVTKADLDPEAATTHAATLSAHVHRPVHVISSTERRGTDDLMAELVAMVRLERERAEAELPEEIVVLRPQPEERFTITRIDDRTFEIEGRRVVTFVEMMDTGMEGARDEIQRRLERWGVAKALQREGIKRGDTMRFGDVELTWE